MKTLMFKQSHTSRKNDVFIVLESETTLPLIIVVIIQNRRKITPKKTLDQFPFLLFTDICVSAQRKGPSVGIFISKKIRFYKAVQNFLKKNFLCEFAYKYSLLCIH